MRPVFLATWSILLGSTAFLSLLPAQAPEDSLDIYTEHPRLFLRPQRLKMLQRERERRSARWVQLETLVAGKAPMTEMGFAQALYFQITGDKEAGTRAIAWALGPATDLRQLALVFDWCQASLTEAQSKALVAKLVRSMAASERDRSVSAARDRALAAVALSGHDQDASSKQLESLVRNWWSKEIVPGLKSGRDMVSREALYPLFELLHAIRDNTNVDLRDTVPFYFKDLSILHLLSYYPASFPAAEGEYRIPAVKAVKEPDLGAATMSRAAEFCMVAYDTNAPQSQSLQGWLLHDNFQLHGLLGTPYEFLWANPYQPGLSYFHLPLIVHDDLFGRLFVRSSWEDSSKWLGYFNGELQVFEDGRPAILNPRTALAPIVLTGAVVLPANYARKFTITIPEEGDSVFVVALKPRQAYEIEVDDEEMREESTDTGGILILQLPAKTPVGVRIREAKQ